MDFEKLTDRARGFLQAAQTIAVREHHQRIAPEHLLKALLDDEQVAKKAGDSYVTVERILLAMALAKNTDVGAALAKAGLTAQNLNAAIEKLRGGRTADTQAAEDRYDALKKFARDLTEAARE